MPRGQNQFTKGRRTKQLESTREKIKVSHIMRRLQKCIDGEIELDAQQIAAAKVLLDKSLPSLQAIEMDAQVDNSHHVISDETMNEDAWNQAYGDSVATSAGTSKSIN